MSAAHTNARVETRRFPGNGLNLTGDVAGPEGAPNIALLHGGGQTRHSWTAAMLRLADEGYRVTNLDLRGHGDSDWADDGDYGFRQLAADLLAVRAALPGPAAFIGASIGGATSFYAAATGGMSAANALVMVDIALRPNSEGAARVSSFMSAHQGGFADLAEAAAAVSAYNPRRRNEDPSGLAKNLRQRSDGRYYWHWDPRLLASEALAEERYRALVAASRDYTTPTLLVRGRSSDVVSDADVANMIQHVPHTEVYEVPGAGHMVVGDRNDVFLGGVLDFLRRHYPAA